MEFEKSLYKLLKHYAKLDLTVEELANKLSLLEENIPRELYRLSIINGFGDMHIKIASAMNICGLDIPYVEESINSRVPESRRTREIKMVLGYN